jgi:hypothetical protein
VAAGAIDDVRHRTRSRSMRGHLSDGLTGTLSTGWRRAGEWRCYAEVQHALGIGRRECQPIGVCRRPPCQGCLPGQA